MDAQNFTTIPWFVDWYREISRPRPPLIIRCQHCGDPVNSDAPAQTRYCTPECTQAAQLPPKKYTPIGTVKGGWLFRCAECGKEFTGRAKMFCSDGCAKASKNRLNAQRKLKAKNSARIKSYKPRATPTPVIDGQKACIDCGEVHPVSEFPKHKDKSVKGGYATISRCKRCKSLFNRIRNRTTKSRRGENVSKLARAAIMRGGTSPRLEELLGYSVADLKAHLERQFTDGMNWKRFLKREIHIDHIIPVARFDFSKDGEWLACWSLDNLQPLWAEDNLSKGAKLDYQVSVGRG